MRDELGKKYKDRISGFEGVAVGYVEYLTGCHQVLLSRAVNDDGSINTTWFDIDRVEELSEPKVVLPTRADRPGGDMPAPIK